MQDQNSLLLKEIKGKEKELGEPPLVDQQTHDYMLSFHLNLGETYQGGEIEETQRQSQRLTAMPYWMLHYSRRDPYSEYEESICSNFYQSTNGTK
ncbi:hypothetical protein L1987_08461 [Smallanthus sonchifolius]|uniref:Uncharacterized protein n=1 Tax=Smallanthus sonchifolius TaxID=185202 RepID=A0ACB9JL53_9ASTR|nr:hypothetical protein L1987_08461 [Smallanthus sonchifolius]